MRAHDVHLFVLVRVKVTGVVAETHLGAMEAAQNRFFEGASDYFRDLAPKGLAAAEVELADGEPTAYFLVDEQGDTEYKNSRHYCADGKTSLLEGDGSCAMCARPLAQAQQEQQQTETEAMSK